MLGFVLYGWLVTVGIIDAFLVSPALRRAIGNPQTTGRLVSTEAVLVGLVLCSSGRLIEIPSLPPLVLAGLLAIDVGLTGYAFTLPEHNLLDMLRRRRG